MGNVEAFSSVVNGEHVNGVVNTTWGGPGELPACATFGRAPAGHDSSASDVREGW